MIYVDKNWLSSFHPCVICHHDDAVENDYDVYKVIRAKLLCPNEIGQWRLK